ncbi:MAG: aerotolerance regulator BatA [candidate division Zixibacteria bacterium SM23_73_3]|nr:MAG: aerotolerance regulator BatA [candidate division Zixibacteria bacterium SM23_73_3]
MFRFQDPIFLVLIPIAIGLLVYYFKFKKVRAASIRYSDVNLVRRLKPSVRLRGRHILPVLRALAIVFLAFALARPQSGRKGQEISSEGIDIMLVLDISGSMRAEDFKPHNRLYVAKQVIKEFIEGRRTDRMGLVVFSKQSFTQCPLTLDYGVLFNFLDQVDFGMIEDGTAIGLAIANAVNRLRESDAKSKVVILLSDGRNNAGEIDPLTAAQAAKAIKVKIYTIGAGKPGNAPYPVDDPIFGRRYIYIENEIDEPTLKQIAQITGGAYFRAKDEKALSRIYKQISQMEQTKIKVKEYLQYNELFSKYAFMGLVLLVIEVILANTRYRKIP